jgi:DNA-binding FadR family transcriptional regulator
VCERIAVLNTQWTEAAIFRPQRRDALAQGIADHLRRRIVSGDLSVGRRLPSIRRMASLFKVSVPTMQAAMHVLVSLGFIRVYPGVGTYVSRPRSAAAVLNHAWLRMTPSELALMRSAIDERMPIVAARLVRTKPPNRLPRTLSDISFWAHERSTSRIGYPQHFLRADLRFHREVARSVRGSETIADLYDGIGERLTHHLVAVADVQAGDDELDSMHLSLAASILDGRTVTSARLARGIARREARSLDESLG